MKVMSLVPGMQIELAGRVGTYVQQARHPIWPHLRLVIWRLADGSWSHDALAGEQDIGAVVPDTPTTRAENLFNALMGNEIDSAVMCPGCNAEALVTRPAEADRRV